MTKTMDMGLFMTVQVVARKMMEYECVGLIMLAASMSRLVTIKGLNALVYTSSKVAAIQLERKEPDKRTRVNSLCPGHILTSMVE